MKVLFFIPTLAHGGAERVLVNLANKLDKEKYDVTVQTLFDVGVNKQLLSDNVNYQYCFKRVIPANTYLFSLFSPNQLYKYLVKGHYDIIVSYLEGLTARIISGCPDDCTKKVCWIHIELNNDKLYARAFRNKKEAIRCYRAFDKIICVSKTVKEIFLKTSGTTYDDIEVIYNTNDCLR